MKNFRIEQNLGREDGGLASLLARIELHYSVLRCLIFAIITIFCETTGYFLGCERRPLSRYRLLKGRISSQITVLAGFLAISMALDDVLAAAEPPPKSIPIELANPAKRVDIDFDHEPGQVVITTTGGDPYFWFELPPAATSARDWVLAFEYFCPQGVRGLEWRWGLPPSQKRTASLPSLAPAEGWTTYRVNLTKLGSVESNARLPVRLDLGNKPGVRLRIRNMQLRPISDRELDVEELALRLRQSKLHLEQQIKSYKQREWPARIESLRKNESGILLSARWNALKTISPDVFLVPRFDWSVSAAPVTAHELALRQPIKLGRNPAWSPWTQPWTRCVGNWSGKPQPDSNPLPRHAMKMSTSKNRARYPVHSGDIKLRKD